MLFCTQNYLKEINKNWSWYHVVKKYNQIVATGTYQFPRAEVSCSISTCSAIIRTCFCDSYFDGCENIIMNESFSINNCSFCKNCGQLSCPQHFSTKKFICGYCREKSKYQRYK